MKGSYAVLVLLIAPFVFGSFSAAPLQFYTPGITPDLGIGVTQVNANEVFSVRTIATSNEYDIIAPTLELPAGCLFTAPQSSDPYGGKHIGNPKSVTEGPTVFYFSGIRCEQGIFDSDIRTIKLTLQSAYNPSGQKVVLTGEIRLSATDRNLIIGPAPPESESVNPIIAFYVPTNTAKKASSVMAETGRSFTVRAEALNGLAPSLKIIGQGCRTSRTVYAPFLSQWAVTCQSVGDYALQAVYYNQGLAFYSDIITVKVIPRKTQSVTCVTMGWGC